MSKPSTLVWLPILSQGRKFLECKNILPLFINLYIYDSCTLQPGTGQDTSCISSNCTSSFFRRTPTTINSPPYLLLTIVGSSWTSFLISYVSGHLPSSSHTHFPTFFRDFFPPLFPSTRSYPSDTSCSNLKQDRLYPSVTSQNPCSRSLNRKRIFLGRPTKVKKENERTETVGDRQSNRSPTKTDIILLM